jgi:hypothetical protein
MKGLSARPSSLSGAVYLIEAPVRRETLILETREITDSAAHGSKSPAKRAFLFAIHQLLATIGVLFWALLLTSLVMRIPRIWGHILHISDVRGVLTMAPYYPIQTVVGLMCGWLVWKQFQHRAMLWVWVFPLMVLVLTMLENSTRTSSMFPGAVISNFRPMLSRLFGSACRMEDHCYEQIGITLPFYMALSYAVGAWSALRFPIRSKSLYKFIIWTLITIGISIFADMIYGLFLNFDQKWWLLLMALVVEGSMGASLIYFAFRMRRIHHQFTAVPPRSERS